MPAELPESYYLDNVLILFRHIETVYGDILDPTQSRFLQDFAGLPAASQRLVIRLLNRSGERFRCGKLEYPEIGPIAAALPALEQAGFIEIPTRPALAEVIPLFTRAELLKHHPQRKKLQSLKRPALNDQLIHDDDETYVRQLFAQEQFIRVLQQETYQIFQMMFFGNRNQSMTDFVLRDLGLQQYEPYCIDASSRPYTSQQEVQQHWQLYQIQQQLEHTEAADLNGWLDLFATIPQHLPRHSPLFGKSERLRLVIARQIERIGELDLALNLYSQCRLPPARERKARIYQRQRRFSTSLSICRDILDQPLEESETQFAIEFSARLARRHNLPPFPEHKISPTKKPQTIELTLPKSDQVEQAVVEHYQRQPGTHACYYLENSLFKGMLGLLLWDVIFAPVPGAFYHPFQYRPSDFYDFDFIAKRKSLVDQVFAQIHDIVDIWQIVQVRWQQKAGRMNPLVNWNALTLDIIEQALQRIDTAHWLVIFQRMLRDLRNHCSGFPDVLQLPAAGGYQLLEVKGPGDRLQKNQQRWMQFFAAHDIPHGVVKVCWQAEDGSKT